MMRCREVRRRLLAFLEAKDAGETSLSEADFGEIPEHLNQCLPCRREAEALRQAIEGLPRRPMVVPPPDLGARIQYHIATQVVAQARRTQLGRVGRLADQLRNRWNQGSAGSREFRQTLRQGIFLAAGTILLFGLLGAVGTCWRPRREIQTASRQEAALPEVRPSPLPAPPLFQAVEPPRGVEEAVAESQRVAQAYGYIRRDREALAAICRAYHARDRRGSLASRGQKEFAVRIATFASSRYEQAQEIAAILDAAGLPVEIAPCRDGQVLVGVYIGPTSYEDTRSLQRKWPSTVVVPYEEVKRARARLEVAFWQTGRVSKPGIHPARPQEEPSTGPARLLPVLMWGLFPAFADYVPTHIEWPGWRVASSENLYAGHRYTRFPLTHLVDGDPRTAWVFSGTGRSRDGWPSRYALALVPEDPVVIDSLALMNGYQRSRALFLRNNRVAQMRLSINGKVLKTVALPDTTGWYRVSLPRQAVKVLQIEFLGFYRGRDDDLCLSELALLNRGQPLDMHLPQAVLFRQGRAGSGEAPGVLLSRRGEVLARDESGKAAWQPQGRYLAGVEGTGGRSQLWIADVALGQVISRQALPTARVTDLRWRDRRTVEVASRVEGPSWRRDCRLQTMEP